MRETPQSTTAHRFPGRNRKLAQRKRRHHRQRQFRFQFVWFSISSSLFTNSIILLQTDNQAGSDDDFTASSTNRIASSRVNPSRSNESTTSPRFLAVERPMISSTRFTPTRTIKTAAAKAKYSNGPSPNVPGLTCSNTLSREISVDQLWISSSWYSFVTRQSIPPIGVLLIHELILPVHSRLLLKQLSSLLRTCSGSCNPGSSAASSDYTTIRSTNWETFQANGQTILSSLC